MKKNLKKILKWSSVFIVISILFIYLLSHQGAVNDDKYPIKNCDHMLPQNIQDIIIPILKENFGSDYSIENDVFYSLITSKQPSAIEARIALLAYYIGEHPGHELIESIIPQHDVAAPLIQKYQKCRPPLRSEWQIGTFRISRTKYIIYNKLVSEKMDRFEAANKAINTDRKTSGL